MLLADIISEHFFSERGDVGLWALSILSISVLVYGANLAVTGAVRLARAIGMSTVIIGATVVSLGTTSPEAFVSVTAALGGKPGLALGNGVGSIICNAAMIFGICCCISRLPKDRFVLRRYGRLQLAAGMLLAGVLGLLAWFAGGFTGVVIPRWVGMCFMLLLLGYLVISVRWAGEHPEILREKAFKGRSRRGRSGRRTLLNVGLLLFGLALVVGGSNVLVGSVGQLCLRYGVPENVLAVTLVAFGTSLPELVTAIASIVKGHPGLLVGNVIGANILNVLFVVGASSSAVPLNVPAEFYYLHVPVMLAALLILRWAIVARGDRFRRRYGVVLVGLFVAYYATMLVLVGSGHLAAEKV